jgi:hypothetical protein
MSDDSDIQEFKQIYEEEFDEPISDAEAHLLATRVITLYGALARPLRSEQERLVGYERSSKMDMSGCPGRDLQNEPAALDQRSSFNNVNSHP